MAVRLPPVIEEFTSDYSIEVRRGGHIVVTLRRAGRAMKVFTGATPAKANSALKNFRQDVKRTWAKLLELEGAAE
jgi:hypothetical protein